MIYIALVLFAALPHIDNPWGQSAAIAFGIVSCVQHFNKGIYETNKNLQRIADLINR